MKNIIRVFLSAYLCFNMLLFPVVPAAYAQVVVDPSDGQAKVINIGGADVIQINAPSAGGVSHNKFTEYNVNENGVILNNSNFKQYNPNSKSQLNGEHVEFNLNFRGGDAAKIILNEVTGNNISTMNGITEVYGNQADLIIANPNGITCIGCGFINVDKLSMIVGRPNMENGNIRDYNIAPMGILSLNGNSEQRFSVNTVNSALLVADMIKLAGDINIGGDLSILTGNDKYDPNTDTVSSVESQIKPSLAIDAYALGAMKAGNIRLYASQTGLGINVENGYVASANGLQITADGSIKVKDLASNENIVIKSGSGVIEQTKSGTITGNKNVKLSGNSSLAGVTNVGENLNITGGNVELSGKLGSEKDISINGSNIELNGTLFAEKDINISGSKVAIGGDYIAASNIDIESVENIKSTAELQSARNINIISSLGDVTLKNTKAGNNININAVSGTILFSGGTIEASKIDLYADSITNKAILVSSNSLVNANKLENMGRFIIRSPGGKGVYNAQFIHNYGQFASAGDLEFNAVWDQINYDQSEILAAGNIDFNTGRNFINYKSEIYSGKDISFAGVQGFLAKLTPSQKNVFGNDESMKTYFELYKNDYKDSIPDFVQLPDYTEAPKYEVKEAADVIKIESTGELLSLDALGEEVKLGDSVVIGDYTIYIGKEVITVNDETGEKFSTFVKPDDDKIYTVKNSFSEVVSYVLDLQKDTVSGGNSATPGGNIGKKSTTDLTVSEADEIKETAFTKDISSSNSLFNIGGRIESNSSIRINTNYLKNIGIDKSVHADGTTLFDKGVVYIGHSGSRNNWEKVEGEVITNTYLDTDAAYIIAGRDITIKAEEISNKSSTISARRDVTINTGTLINQASSYSTNLYERSERKTRKRFGSYRRRVVTYTDTKMNTVSFYSAESAKILAGNKLTLSAESFINDQTENVRGAYDDKTKEIDLDYVSNFKLPEGKGGLFRVTNNSKYLVQGNYLVLNPANYIGSDYFFKQLGMKNADKLLGDPAYETRLIMDQIRAKIRHSDSLSDADQMKTLYDNAIAQSSELGLSVGVALTKEQIGQLKSSIVWYTYEDVEGQKVLVPKLYIAASEEQRATGATVAANHVDIKAAQLNNSGVIDGRTLVNIQSKRLQNIGRKAAISSGDTTVIESDYIYNSGGTISGKEAVSLKANTIVNESNFRNRASIVSGGTTNIQAQALRNNSGYISGDRVFINVKSIVNKDERGYQASEIAADSLLYLETDNFHITNSNSGKYKSSKDAVIKAKNVVFDTSNTGVFHKPVIDITGTLQIEAENDAVFKGAVVNAGNALITAGKNLRIENDYKNGVTGSEFNIDGELLMSSGGDTTIIGSTINASKAFIQSGGNLTIAEAYNSSGARIKIGRQMQRRYVNSSSSVAVGSKLNIGGRLELVSGGDVNIKASQVKADSALIKSKGNINILEAYTNTQSVSTGSHIHYRTSTYGNERKVYNSSSSVAVGSKLDIGGRLDMVSGGDTTIRGSNIKANMAVIDTVGSLNVVEAYNTVQSQISNRIPKKIYNQSSGSSIATAVGSSIDVKNMLYIESKKNITIRGSQLSAKNAYIEAAGQITVAEAYNKRTSPGATSLQYDYYGVIYNPIRNSQINSSSSTVVGSQINIGNRIDLVSASDILIKGSNISALNAGIKAKGNIVLAEAYNSHRESSSNSYYSTRDWGYRSRYNNDSNIVVGSSVNIGNTLVTHSGGNTVVNGSKVNAAQASIRADGNLVIAEAYNTHTASSQGLNRSWSRGRRSSYSTTAHTATGSSINAGESLDLIAGKNMLIRGSEIKSNDMYLNSVGDLTIENAKNSYAHYNRGGYNTSTSVAGSNLTAGMLTVVAGGDATLKASYIKTDSANINAGGNFAMTNDINSSYARWGSGQSSSTTVVGASIDANNLSVKTGKDFIMTASTINAGNAKLKIGGDLVMNEDYNTTYYRSVKKKKRTFSSRTKTVERETSTSVGSAINTTGNLALDVDGDANFRGAKLTAGNALINVGGNVNIEAVTDYVYSYSKTKKSSWGGLKKSSSMHKSRQEKLAASNVKVNDGLIIISGGNTVVIGSKISSGGNTDIFAGYKLNDDGTMSKTGIGGSLIIAAGNENSFYEKQHSKKNSMMGKASKSTIKNEYTTAVGSKVDVGGSFNVSTDGDMVVFGSTINADNALLNIGRSLAIVNAENVENKYSKKDSTGLWKLKGKGQKNIEIITTVVGSELNINKNLTVVTGKDTNLVSSNINAGSTRIYTGHVLNSDGTLRASETGGSFNMGNEYNTYAGVHKSYSYKVGFEPGNFLRGIANGLLTSGVIAGTGSLIDTRLGATAGAVVGLTLGLIDGVNLKVKSSSGSDNVITAVQSQINTGDLSIVSADDVNLQGRINITNKADILAGFTKNQDGTITQNGRGTVRIISDNDYKKGKNQKISAKAEIDIVSPILDAEIKAKGKLSKGEYEVETLVQTSISAKELNIAAGNDIKASGADLKAKTVSLTAISVNVDLGTKKIVKDTSGLGLDAEITGTSNLIKAAFNIGSISKAVKSSSVVDMMERLGKSGALTDIYVDAKGKYGQENTVTNIGTSVTADKIVVNAGKDFKMTGSNLNGIDINITAKNVIMESIRDKSFAIKDTNASISADFRMKKVAGDASFNGRGTAEFDITNKESSINGKNVTINAKKDMMLIGSSINGDSINLNVGRNLLATATYDLNISATINAKGDVSFGKDLIKAVVPEDKNAEQDLLGVFKAINLDEFNIAPGIAVEIGSNSSIIKGNNIDVKVGNSTTLISSSIAAQNDVNIDAGKVLTLIGLPDKVSVSGGVEPSVSHIDGILKGKLDSAFAKGKISEANRSSITAGNNISGKAGYAIISVNGDIESSKGKGAKKNFDKGLLIPILIEKDLNTQTGFDSVRFNKDIAETPNVASGIVESQKN